MVMQPAQIGALLKRARLDWQLSVADAAHRASVSEVTLRVAERSGKVSVSDLSAIAAALGGSFDDIVTGREFWTATSIALKTSQASFELPLVRARLIATAAAANDHRALTRFLALPDQWPKGAALGPRSVPHDVVRQAEILAAEVRTTIGAGSHPISSVRESSAQLGVASFLTDLGTGVVDGLMWRERGSAPCIAANVAARSGATTAIRMTLAHELCHALFDRPKTDADGILERRTDDASGREQRANAFAAYLLAPRAAVLDSLHRLGWNQSLPPTRQMLRSLAQYFGMGVEAMAYHLVNCQVWSKEEALRNKTFSVPYTSDDDREHSAASPAEQRVGLERRGYVLDLATQALAAGRISVGRWRELIGLDIHSDWSLLLAERHVEV